MSTKDTLASVIASVDYSNTYKVWIPCKFYFHTRIICLLLFENLDNTQINYTLAYGSHCSKRTRHKNLIIRGFTVGAEQNVDVYYYG